MEALKKLKTFEDACKVEGLDPKKVIPDFSCYPKKDRKAMIAHAKLVIIVRAANRLANGGKEWVADYKNANQWKYEARFFRGSSGFRFYDFVTWASHSLVGSRLCFISYDVTKYVATKFIKLYNEYML